MDENQLLADQPLGQKLIKKGFWLYFFMIITAPVGYLIKVIVSNTLSVEDVGIFYSVLGFVLLISIYHDLGLTEALQYFLPKYRIEKKYDHYKTIIFLTLFAQVTIGIAIACLIYFGADRLALNHFRSSKSTEIIKALAIYFIGINFLQVLTSIFISFQDAIYNSFLDFLRSYSLLIFTIIFWTSHTLTTETFGIGWISGLGIGLIGGIIIFFKKYIKTLKKWKIIREIGLIKKQFKYALWIFLGANIGNLLGQLDLQMIINIIGPKGAGYYSNFLSLLTTYSVIITPILTLIFPIVTELITKGNHSQLKEFQTILYKYFSIFALSIGGLFFAFGPEIASILFGEKFLYSGKLLIYISPFLIFNVLYIINFGILAGLGKVKERVKTLLLALIVNVIINFGLLYIFKIGLTGAIIAMIAGWLILRRGSFKTIQKQQIILFDRNFLIKNILIIATISGIFFITKGYFISIDNNLRWVNLGYISIAIIIFYILLAIINYKSINFLMKEIKVFKK